MATEICSEKIVITEIPLSIHRYPIGIIVKSIKCYFWFDIIALLAILHFCYSTLWLPNTKPQHATESNSFKQQKNDHNNVYIFLHYAILDTELGHAHEIRIR